MKKEQGIGTVVLLAVTVLVVSSAFALGGYAIGMRQATALQQAGFLPWAGSSFWADITLNPLNAPGSGIWYRFIPGTGLDFAFIFAPEFRAAIAGLAMLCGATLIVFTILTWQRNPLRLLFMLVSWGFLGLSVVPLLASAPDSFGADMKHAVLRDAVLQPGDLLALSSVTGFAEGPAPPRLGIGQGFVVYATTEDNGQFLLGVLNNEEQAEALVGLLQQFTGSKGQQM